MPFVDCSIAACSMQIAFVHFIEDSLDRGAKAVLCAEEGGKHGIKGWGLHFGRVNLISNLKRYPKRKSHAKRFF